MTGIRHHRECPGSRTGKRVDPRLALGCAASDPAPEPGSFGEPDTLDGWDGAQDWARAVLREVGLSTTRPRIMVLATLRGRARPLTAQDLHFELKTRLRRDRSAEMAPGLTTVYRVLAALGERGILHCFHRDGAGVTTYRLCAPVRHHHLMCRCCGLVAEQYPAPTQDLLDLIGPTGGFLVEDYRAELIGLCAACQPSSATSRGPACRSD